MKKMIKMHQGHSIVSFGVVFFIYVNIFIILCYNSEEIQLKIIRSISLYFAAFR